MATLESEYPLNRRFNRSAVNRVPLSDSVVEKECNAWRVSMERTEEGRKNSRRGGGLTLPQVRPPSSFLIDTTSKTPGLERAQTRRNPRRSIDGNMNRNERNMRRNGVEREKRNRKRVRLWTEQTTMPNEGQQFGKETMLMKAV